MHHTYIGWIVAHATWQKLGNPSCLVRQTGWKCGTCFCAVFLFKTLVVRDADSASCCVAELVSQELPQLLLTIDCIILSSVSQFSMFFISLIKISLTFSCFHKLIFRFMSYFHSSFLSFYPFHCLPFPLLPHLPHIGPCLPRSIATLLICISACQNSFCEDKRDWQYLFFSFTSISTFLNIQLSCQHPFTITCLVFQINVFQMTLPLVSLWYWYWLCLTTLGSRDAHSKLKTHASNGDCERKCGEQKRLGFGSTQSATRG